MVSKMQIMKSIYKKLLNMPSVPPEMGGILGSKNNVIDEIKFDRKITSCESGIYVPEVKILNKYIQEWNERGFNSKDFFIHMLLTGLNYRRMIKNILYVL